jgi:hypothetical protein
VAVEFERVVPASGNMTAGGRQIWLGRPLAGQTVTIWVSSTTLLVFHREQLIKTHPVTLAGDDLARLHAQGARPGRPAPATAVPAGPLAAATVVEVDRAVNNYGLVSLNGRQISVGIPHAGKRVALRIDDQVIQVISDGTVLCTRPSPLTGDQRARLRGARLSGRATTAPSQAQRVQRVISSSGTVMVAGSKLHVGHTHRGKIVTIVLEDTQFRILHDGQQLAVHPRTQIKEVNRLRASGHIDYAN